tara:strand:+ start:846 stop:1034 length:189 start_codon:yes stop_codon:yes gene_type:complete
MNEIEKEKRKKKEKEKSERQKQKQTKQGINTQWGKNRRRSEKSESLGHDSYRDRFSKRDRFS